MFKVGDKIRQIKTGKSGIVVEIMPGTWIRPIKVQFEGEKFFNYYTQEGCGNTLNSEIAIELW